MFAARKRLLLALLLLGAAAPFAWGLAFRGEYPTRQAAERSFVIDENFTTVRKILVRKDAAKQIVTMGGDSEFVSQTWDSVGADIDSLKLLDPDWRLELSGQLQVRTLDPYVGQAVITLDQEVEITVDLVDSQVALGSGSERLIGYEMGTRFSRNEEGKTLVELQLAQEIKTDAPWFAHAIADRRVRAAVEQSLANQEQAIRDVIAANRDDVPLLPLR